MLQLLYTLVFSEMALILVLVLSTPGKKLLIRGLDHMKQGKGPLVAKSVGGTLFVVFASTLYSVIDIHKHSTDASPANPTDQVLMAFHLLEASLMGFALFLGLTIDRIHHYIKELHRLRNHLEVATKQQSHVNEDSEKRKNH